MPASNRTKTLVSVFGVRPTRIGGTETFARELSLQLHARGWKSVLCFLAEPADEVRAFLDVANISIEVVENVTHVNWSAAASLARVIRKYRADALHLHYTGFLGLYPWLARLSSVKQVFFTDHSSRPAGYVARRAPLWKRVAARAINAPVTKVVCVSKYGQECMTTLDLLPRERHELVYNAVDRSRIANGTSSLAFKQRYQIPDDRVLIVQVSWMIREKGIPELLRIARLLIEKNPRVHFVLVGDGSCREQFMKEADAMGLSSHITWTGLIKDPFGEGVYSAADIVCQLSDWEELFGWMIAEAMAHGKPIVATRVGGIPELIAEGVSGFLVSRGETEAAVARLDELARNTGLRKRMGAAGANLVNQKFDLRRNVAQLVSLYDA